MSPERGGEQQGLGAPSTEGLLGRLTAPSVVFTAVGVILLAVIWGGTLVLAHRELAAAERTAAASVADLAETYEAQVVRALREIDHALRLVRHELERNAAPDVLKELGAKGLLPPERLFTVTVTGSRGEVIASNGSPPHDFSGFEFFRRARAGHSPLVSQPRRDAGRDEWRLRFIRRLEGPGGAFGGVVAISVHSGYFVSGYELRALGKNGVLGLIGTDGIFRARRTGGDISAGGHVDFDALLTAEREEQGAARTNDWDGVRRYTVAKKLFDFPIAVVVGLSETEQLASAKVLRRNYLKRAGAASVALFGIVGLLGRLSWQLQRTRARVTAERIAHAERTEYLAFHDNLTELPNRAYFTRLLSQCIRQARRSGGELGLLFLDLDRFKAVNDSLGHDVGDELLREIAHRLRASVRESDIVARLGGDEFVVLLPETRSASHAGPVAGKILEAIGKPLSLAGREFRITVSIGITSCPGDGEDEQTLIKNADVAMYHAKEQGRNNFQFYSEELNADSLERLALESSLRHALERNELTLFYQAKRSLVTNRVTGMEALLRWDHPELGLVLPAHFVPLAEETGLIVPIGRWVLRTACHQNATWQAEGFPPLSMAVNLSARQFLDEGLVEDISAALNDSGMDPSLLEIEITESMIMREVGRTAQVLKALQDMGVRVAIDDFGTGYSSLSTLKQFPLDSIKIDRSFVSDVVRSREDMGLTEAIISVGRCLGLTVVAEGVETPDQVEFLRTHACDEFQGFLSDKPMPADAFARFMRSQLTMVKRPY